jgi:uncharacterized membrane protein YqgA involved in biofilm formation
VRGLGTIINVLAIVAGSGVGILVGSRLPDRVRETILQGLGLVVLAVAIVGFEPLYDPDDGLRRFVILIGSIVAGGVIGELLRLEDRVERAGERLRDRLHVPDDEEEVVGRTHPTFVEGFVIATTVYVVGALAILGAIEDGVGIGLRLLAIKAALDGIASVGFAAVYGWGVMASILPVAIYQGVLTAAAAAIEPLFTDEVLAVLGATGSLLVLAIGLKLLDVAHVRIVNLLPALFLAPLVAGLLEVA